MNKCTDCSNCSDIDNCDKFYITEQHSITIPVGVDEETGETIRKKFSGKTEHEAIYKSEQFKKENPLCVTSKPRKILPQTIEAITLEYMTEKNNNGTNIDSTYRTYTEILNSLDFEYSHRDEYLISIHCGLRIGEMLALEKRDIDFEKGVIHVKRTTTTDKNGHTILGTHTKTPSGERDIPMNELTIPVLKHAVENMIPNENDLLFCTKKGTVYTDSALNSCFKKICKKIGILSNAHNHKLRHSFSTNGVVAGIDYMVLKETMGHSDIRETIDTYADAPMQFKEDELQKYVDKIKMELGDSIYDFYAKDEKQTIP